MSCGGCFLGRMLGRLFRGGMPMVMVVVVVGGIGIGGGGMGGGRGMLRGVGLGR